MLKTNYKKKKIDIQVNITDGLHVYHDYKS